MRITAYTSSSDAVGGRYRAAAEAFGTAVGARGDELVYGGTAVGLMGVVSCAVRDAGGRVTGVVPQLMVDRGLGDERCDELVVTADMAGRKQEMIGRADAFVALPGGFGTLEELLEVLTLKQLGYHRKPIVMLDVDGFWQPLLAFCEHLFAADFAKREYAQLYAVLPDPAAVLGYLDSYEPGELPTKWL